MNLLNKILMFILVCLIVSYTIILIEKHIPGVSGDNTCVAGSLLCELMREEGIQVTEVPAPASYIPPSSSQTSLPSSGSQLQRLSSDLQIGDKFKLPVINNGSSLHDMYPIYTCPNLSNAYILPIWYGGCIDACQITSSRRSTNVKIYTVNSTVSTQPGYKVTVLYESKFSHVSPFGSCSLSLAERDFRQATEAQVAGWAESIFTKWPQAPEEWILYKDPPCNYFADEYSSGYILKIEPVKINVFIDVQGNLYVPNLASNTYDSYRDGQAVHGSTFWIWEVSDTAPSGKCYFQQTDDTYCERDNSTNRMYCKFSGIAFSNDIAQNIRSDCAGDLNISTDGVIYQLGDTASTPSTQARLSDILRSNPQLGIQSLTSLINDVFINIESAYCTGMCDIMEVILSNYPTATTVLETPVGSWLPITISGHSMMTPCIADVSWVIKSPISFCYSGKMLKVIHQDSSQEGWWRIINSYVISNETCSDANSTELEIVKRRMTLKQDIVYSFWRGDLIVSYPYNRSRWVTYKDEKIQRSSKWFDKLEELSMKYPITLENITSLLVNHTSNIYNDHIDSDSQHHSTTFGDVLNRISKASGNILKWGVKLVGSVAIWVMQNIEIVGDIVITGVCCVCGYYIVWKPLRYITTRRVTRTQTSDGYVRDPMRGRLI